MSTMDPTRFCFSALLSAFIIAVALLQRPVLAGPIPVFPSQRQQDVFSERGTQVVFERRVTAEKSVIRTKFTPEDTRTSSIFNNPTDSSRFSSTTSNRDPEDLGRFQEISRTRSTEFPFPTGQEIRDSKSGFLHSNPDCLQPVKTLSNACSHPGFFYIEGDCKKYLVCLSGSRNVLESFVVACPDDKLFSRIYRRCVPPHLSDCGRNVEYEHVPRHATISPEIFDRYLAHYGITSERLSKFLESDNAVNAFNLQQNNHGIPKVTESERIEISEPKRYPDEKFKNVDVRIEEKFTIPENFDSQSEIPVEVVKEFEVVSEIDTPAHGIPTELTNSESSFDPRPPSSDDEPAIPYPYVSSGDVDFDKEPATSESQTQFENSNEKEDAKSVPEEYLSKIPSDSEAEVPIAYSVPDEVETLPESTKEFEVASEIQTPANPIQLEDVYDPVEISDPELPFQPTLAANDAGSAIGYTDVPSGDEFGKDAAQYESDVQFENSMEEGRISNETPTEEAYVPEIPADVPADSVDVREEFLRPNDFTAPEFLIESEANDDEKAEESVKEFEVVTEVEEFNGATELADSELPLEPIQVNEDELAVAYPGVVSGDEDELGFDKHQSEFEDQKQSEKGNDDDTDIPKEEIYVTPHSTTEHEIPDAEEELYSRRDFQVPVFSSESESETLSEPLKEVGIVSEFETPAEGIQLDEVNGLPQISDSEITFETAQPSDEAESVFVYPDVSNGGVGYDKEPADFQTGFENSNEEDKTIPEEELNIPPYSSTEYEIPVEHSTSTDKDFPVPLVVVADGDQTPSESVEELEIVSEVETPVDGFPLEEFGDQSEVSDSEPPLLPIHSSDEGGPGIGYTWASSDDFSIDKQPKLGDDKETELVNEDDLVVPEEETYLAPHSTIEYEIPSEEEILDVKEKFHSPEDFPVPEFPIESEANEDSERLLEQFQLSGEAEVPIAYPATDEVETLPESVKEFEIVSEVEEFNNPAEFSDSVETLADPIQVEDVYDPAEISYPELPFEPTLAAGDDELPIIYADVPSGDVEFDKGAVDFESQAQFENSTEDGRITPEGIHLPEIPSDANVPADPVDVNEEFNSPNDFSVPEFPTEYETNDGETLPESVKEIEVVSEVQEFNDPAEISDSEPPFEVVQSSGEDGAAIGYPDASRDDFSTDKDPEFEIEAETRSENNEDEVVAPEEQSYVPPHSSSTEFEILSEHESTVANKEFQNADDFPVPEFPMEAEANEDSDGELLLESAQPSADDELASGFPDEDEKMTETVREFEVVSEIETPADEIQLEEVYDRAETSDSELPFQPALPSSNDEPATAYTEASGGEVQLDKDEAEFETITRVENSEDEDAIIPEEETYLPAIPSEAEVPEDTVVIDEESYSPSDFSVPEFPTEFEKNDDQKIPEFVNVSEVEEFNETPEFSESEQPFLPSSDPEAAISYPDFSSDQISYDKDPAEVEGQSQTEPEKVVIVEDDTESTEGPLQSNTEPYELPTEQGVPDVNEEFYIPSETPVPEFPVASEVNPDESLTESVKEFEVVSEFETPVQEIQLEPLNDEAEITDSERPLESVQPFEKELEIPYPDDNADDSFASFAKNSAESTGQIQPARSNEHDIAVSEEQTRPSYPGNEYEIPSEIETQTEFGVHEDETQSESSKEVQFVSEVETPSDEILPTDVSKGDVEYDKKPADFQDQTEFVKEDKAIPEEELNIPPYSSAEYEIPAEHSPSSDEDFPVPVVPTESEADEDVKLQESAEELQIVSEVETPADEIQLEEFTDQPGTSDSELLLERVKGSDEDELPITYPELSSEDSSLDKQAVGFEVVTQPEKTNDGDAAVVDVSGEEIYPSPPHSEAEEGTAADKHFPVHGIPVESESDDDKLSTTEPEDVATQTSEELPEPYNLENHEQPRD